MGFFTNNRIVHTLQFALDIANNLQRRSRKPTVELRKRTAFLRLRLLSLKLLNLVEYHSSVLGIESIPLDKVLFPNEHHIGYQFASKSF